MSFLGRVMADAQRRVTVSPDVRAMPASAPALAQEAAEGDSTSAAPMMDADVFGAADQAHADRLRASAEHGPSQGQARPVEAELRYGADAPMSAKRMTDAAGSPAGNALHISSNPVQAVVAPQPSSPVAARTVAHEALAGDDPSRTNASSQYRHAYSNAAGAEASAPAGERVRPSRRMQAKDSRSITDAPADHADDGVRPRASALDPGTTDSPNVRAPVPAETAGHNASSFDARTDEPAGTAPQARRPERAAADMAADATNTQAMRLQRTLSVDEPAALRTNTLRPAMAATPDTASSPRVTRSAQTVRIDHVDIVVTEPPSRPRRGVQERPGNPASRNYLRRL